MCDLTVGVRRFKPGKANLPQEPIVQFPCENLFAIPLAGLVGECAILGWRAMRVIKQEGHRGVLCRGDL